MKSHWVSLSLIESHGSMTARVEVWEQYLEHLRVWSTPCVSAPCWVGSSSLGHPRHGSQYVTVVWSCAVPMCRLCCLRCAFEWNGRRMSTACALLKRLKTWTSGGSYSLWPSLEPWQSREINRNLGFRVSDGFCCRMVSLYFDSVRICRTGHAACPDLVL